MVIPLLASSCALAIIAPLSQSTLAERGTRQAFTHTVLAEDLTTFFCPHCPTASEQLKSIYESGDYPFYFVSLIADTNEDAYDRCMNDYNVPSYPVIQFDGGYRMKHGAQEDESVYRQDIEESGERDVHDITIEVNSTYHEEAVLDIQVKVHNDLANGYSGHLRTYITEIDSRYQDYDGNNYPFAFLSYAFDEDISIPGGDWIERDTTWSGSEHQDNYGNDFGDIDPDNIMIIAAVFNSEGHQQSYDSHPPKSYTAYWVDQTAACTVEGNGGPGDNGGSDNGDEYSVSITNVDHSPDNPTTEDQITFSATITGDVDSVKVVICSKTTETCKPPVAMKIDTGDRYTATAGPYEEDDYAYHIIVTDPGGSNHQSEEYTFKVVGEDSSEESGFIPGLSESQSSLMLILILILIVVITVGLVLKRRSGVETVASKGEQASISAPSPTPIVVQKTTSQKSSYENITCPSCSSVFAVPSGMRPIRVQCPNCGTKGKLE